MSLSQKRNAYIDAINADRAANLVEELIQKLLGLALLNIRHHNEEQWNDRGD